MSSAQPMPPAVITQAKPEEVVQPVQGIMPDSKNEWYTALALDKLEIAYTFQYVLDGGTGIRGGQIVDFVCWMPAGPLPVFVQGAYWHKITTETEDLIKQAAAAQAFGRQPVLLMEEETSTKDKAMRAVREKIA